MCLKTGNFEEAIKEFVDKDSDISPEHPIYTAVRVLLRACTSAS